jgi:signal transduction histidine kinase
MVGLRPLHLPLAILACVGSVLTAGASGLIPVVSGDAVGVGFAAVSASLAGIGAVLLRASVGERGRRVARAERRRIARDLHDGVAQELAFLVTQAKTIRRSEAAVDSLRLLEATAQRALDETRLAITGLTSDGSETVAAAIEVAAQEVADREGVRLLLELDDAVDVPAHVRDDFVRIVCEAATNAIRHGRASALKVVLSGGDAVRLQVIDDGVGFEPSRVPNRGGRFGLISMSERARALGGDLRIVSEPGMGTRVELAVQ